MTPQIEEKTRESQKNILSQICKQYLKKKHSTNETIQANNYYGICTYERYF